MATTKWPKNPDGSYQTKNPDGTFTPNDGGPAAPATEPAGGNGFLEDAGSVLKSAADKTGEFLEDSFSGETVPGPAAGAYGQTSGPAAGIYADQADAGAAAQARYGNAAARAGDTAFEGSGAANRRAQIIGNRSVPTTNYTPANRALGGAENTVAALNEFAGAQDGPSGAQAQLSQATQQGLAQQLALARSGRGFGSNSANLGQAQSAMAGVTANAANESAALKAREFASARERQLQALNSSMGGDISLGQQYGNQAQFQTQSKLQSQAQNDAAALGQGQLGLGYQQFGANTALGYGKLGEESALQREQLGQHALDQQAEFELAQQKMWLEAQKANQSMDTERDASGIGFFEKILSDERSKQKIEQLEGALASSLGKPALETARGAPAYSYEYKDPTQPGAKAGRMVGPMAQDLERGPLGNTVVADTPQGKKVDAGRLTMVNTSAIAEQQKQLDALRRALGGKAA